MVLLLHFLYVLVFVSSEKNTSFDYISQSQGYES